MNVNNNPFKNKNFLESLKHALDGIAMVLTNERNARIQLACAVLAVIVGLFLGLTAMEWLWILLVIFLVVIFEYLNTVIETIINLIVGTKYNEYAKIAKDIGAGMVLISSIFALIVALIIFGPKMLQVIGG